MSNALASNANDPLSVFDLTIAVKYRLQTSFTNLWVTGEVSGFSQPRSGHCYFTLKDDRAQINAIIWRSTAERMKFAVENGQSVLCFGGLDVYPQRGTYQLIVDRVEPLGTGSLELAFRQRHARLEKEGLFDPARKRPLPAIPKRVAVVTSPSGAAIHDFLQVVRRRWCGIEIVIVPTAVQGQEAAGQIAQAIQICQRIEPRPDVVVVTRGGGSLEDLWSFNEEVVCRAIAESSIPVISGVGHEVDVTLSDLAADVRALTPSEAAERLVPDRAEVAVLLQNYQRRLQRGLAARLSRARAELERIAQSPALTRPLQRIHELSWDLDRLDQRLRSSLQDRLNRAQSSLQALAARFEALNPTAVLARGFSMTRTEQGKCLRDARELNMGDIIQTQLMRGVVTSQVQSIGNSNSESTE